MSCCGGKCGCGSGCGCGSACGGCKMFPDMENEMTATTGTMVLGFGAEKASFQGFEMAASSEGGCKCGANCTCDPCTCK